MASVEKQRGLIVSFLHVLRNTPARVLPNTPSKRAYPHIRTNLREGRSHIVLKNLQSGLKLLF